MRRNAIVRPPSSRIESLNRVHQNLRLPSIDLEWAFTALSCRHSCGYGSDWRRPADMGQILNPLSVRNEVAEGSGPSGATTNAQCQRRASEKVEGGGPTLS